MDLTTARSPRQLTCDSSTAGRLAVAGTLAMQRSRWLALAALAVVLGAAYGQVFSWPVGVVAGLLMLATALGVRNAQLRKAMRRIAPRGSVMATGYDPEGRFVATTSQGATGLDRGSVAAWSRSGAVVVLRLHQRPMRLLLPAELVDDADLAFLTDRSAGVAAPGDGPSSAAARMPFHLTVTARDQALLSRAAVRLWLTRRQTWLVLGLDAVGLVAGLLLQSWLLVAVAVLAAALCGRAPWSMRRALREAYPVGSEIRSGLTDDALLLQTVVSTEKVLRSTVVGVLPGPGVITVELSGRRRIVLPSRLLSAQVVATLAAHASQA